MSTDLSVETKLKPGPVRRAVRIRSILLAVVGAVILGYLVGLDLCHRRVRTADKRLSLAVGQIMRDNRPLWIGGRMRADRPPRTVTYHWQGGHAESVDQLYTESDREITVVTEARFGLLGYGPDRVTLRFEDRTVTRPYEDFERHRKVDLRAMFPEAFR
jgi:hypothetical protein